MHLDVLLTPALTCLASRLAAESLPSTPAGLGVPRAAQCECKTAWAFETPSKSRCVCWIVEFSAASHQQPFDAPEKSADRWTAARRMASAAHEACLNAVQVERRKSMHRQPIDLIGRLKAGDKCPLHRSRRHSRRCTHHNISQDLQSTLRRLHAAVPPFACATYQQCFTAPQRCSVQGHLADCTPALAAIGSPTQLRINR